MEKLEEVLQCPVCLERVTPPTLQCKNQHTVCKIKCGAQLTQCLVCRGEFDYNRTNVHLEKVLEVIPVTCQNKENGCVCLLTKDQMVQHEKVCDYVLTKCFVCCIDIAYFKLADHLLLAHNVKIDCKFEIKETSIHQITKQSDKLRFLQEKNSNQLFILLCYFKDPNKNVLHISVFYFGKREDCKKYSFQASFLHKNISFSSGNFCQPPPNKLDAAEGVDFDLNKSIFSSNKPSKLTITLKIINTED